MSDENGQPKKPGISDLSPDASLLRQRLEAAKIGEMITYGELSGVIGREIRERRSALYRARQILLREKSYVFIAVKKVGIQRLSSEEIARLGEGYARRIRKVATRGMRVLACVENFDQLSAESQVSHNTGMSVLAFMREAMKPGRWKQVEEKVRESRHALPSSKLLELFK